jgi:hypothetical protein
MSRRQKTPKRPVDAKALEQPALRKPLVDLAGLSEDHPERNRQARNVDQILEEDYPELIRDSVRDVVETRANRPQRQAALIKEFHALVGPLSERNLETFCWMAMEDPGWLLYLQGRKLLAPITFYLMRAHLKGKPRWSPSDHEIGSMRDRMEHLSNARAFRVLARATRQSPEAVRAHYKRYKKTKN